MRLKLSVLLMIASLAGASDRPEWDDPAVIHAGIERPVDAPAAIDSKAREVF